MILLGMYIAVGKVRVGERPIWPIDFDEDALSFTIGSLLLIFSFKLCELVGRWGQLLDDLRKSATCIVVATCLQISSSKLPWAVGGQTCGYFIFFGVVFDEAYQDGCKNGTELRFGDILPALFRGRLRQEMRKGEENRRRRKELEFREEKSDLGKESVESCLDAPLLETV